MIITPAYKAMLDLVAWSEGTSDNRLTKNNGYDVIVSGPDGEEVFTDYSDHPFAKGRPAKLVDPHSVPVLYSTASGRYQLMLRWWRAYQGMLHLADFSPASQDQIALRQMQETGALRSLDQGDIQSAIFQCATRWMSFPGTPTAQGNGPHSMNAMLGMYTSFSTGSNLSQA